MTTDATPGSANALGQKVQCARPLPSLSTSEHQAPNDMKPVSEDASSVLRRPARRDASSAFASIGSLRTDTSPLPYPGCGPSPSCNIEVIRRLIPTIRRTTPGVPPVNGNSTVTPTLLADASNSNPPYQSASC